MPSRSPEVRVLKQQVATHRKGSNAYQQSDVELKIAIVGPSKCGKTRLANQLAAIPLLSSDLSAVLPYQETAGVRILNFPTQISASPLPPAKAAPLDLAVNVELWDVSGSADYEGGWPAVCDGLDGLIVCFDPTSKQQVSDIKVWSEWFVREADLKQGQVMAWAIGGAASGKQMKLVVKDADNAERSVVVPVVTIRLDGGEDGGPGQPQSRQELDSWLGSTVFAHHPKAAAEFETFAK